MTFEKFLKQRDIVEHGSIRVSDCRAAWDAGRQAAAEECGQIITDTMDKWGASGSYVDFGNQLAAAIRERFV